MGRSHIIYIKILKCIKGGRAENVLPQFFCIVIAIEVVQREMEIDWAQAWQVGGISFGLVFVVLAILAVVTWLLSLVLNRNSSGSDETETKKEE